MSPLKRSQGPPRVSLATLWDSLSRGVQNLARLLLAVVQNWIKSGCILDATQGAWSPRSWRSLPEEALSPRRREGWWGRKELACLGTEGGRVTSRERGGRRKWRRRWSGAADEAGPCRNFKRPFLLSSEQWVTKSMGRLKVPKASWRGLWLWCSLGWVSFFDLVMVRLPEISKNCHGWQHIRICMLITRFSNISMRIGVQGGT